MIWLGIGASAAAQTPLPVTTPLQALGFNVGDDYQVASYSQTVAYWRTLDAESTRMTMVDIGETAEGRRQWMAIVSSPANLARLDYYKNIARQLALARGPGLEGAQLPEGDGIAGRLPSTSDALLTEEAARQLAQAGKAVVWIDGGLHSNETAGSQQLIEMVYQMVSRTDAETLRLLDDVIQLYVPANPDGMELVADWYMREPAPERRSLENLPRLYHKYIGHDDNRDFFMSNMPETTNMNRQLFREWFPQIVYNHHQTTATGNVVFIPPFRDPFNYNLDPLVPLGIDMVGAAMHSRLVGEGKAGSVMRDEASYSAWWNGGLRTVSYFHNMIGILTEIVGSPTPMEIPLIPATQLPRGDAPLPVAPQVWHFRQTIDYEITQNRALLDYASRYRETLLFNIYKMAANSIERGSRDHWTVTPSRIEALLKAANTRADRRIPAGFYESVLQDRTARDPRAYVVSADPATQPDLPTAITFINALIKSGITVHRAEWEFALADKRYPAGSFVVKTAQAFRPHILDMFEPQDHPDDVAFSGGPPVPPYDIAGWTLALQMGVAFDRILEGAELAALEGEDSPLSPITDLLPPPAATITGSAVTEGGVETSAAPAGYCVGHRLNNAFTVLNRLLASGRDVYWMQSDGAFCTPAHPDALEVLSRGAAELGVPVFATESAPSGSSLRLKQPRIALFDQYGGIASSGWTRWLMEQFEFPFEVIYPASLDAAAPLRDRYDVILFTDLAYRDGVPAPRQPSADSIPGEYRDRLGALTQSATLPRLRQFVEAGGTLLAIGSSTGLAGPLGIPLIDHLVEPTQSGGTRGLGRSQFYIPGSLVRTRLDPTHPIAAGMPEDPVVFFVGSPVFTLGESSEGNQGRSQRVVWYEGGESLVSGWALGEQYLNGGNAVAEARLGAGKVILFGPEVAFRGQSHATFKLLFNSLLYGPAEPVTLP